MIRSLPIPEVHSSTHVTDQCAAAPLDHHGTALQRRRGRPRLSRRRGRGTVPSPGREPDLPAQSPPDGCIRTGPRQVLCLGVDGRLAGVAE